MERLEYFSRVMRIVAELMDVSEQDILGKSREYEVVDARWIVIYLMREQGCTTKQIASMINHPIRTINHALNLFSIRAKNPYSGLGNTLAMVRQQLSNNS